MSCTFVQTIIEKIIIIKIKKALDARIKTNVGIALNTLGSKVTEMFSSPRSSYATSAVSGCPQRR